MKFIPVFPNSWNQAGEVEEYHSAMAFDCGADELSAAGVERGAPDESIMDGLGGKIVGHLRDESGRLKAIICDEA